MNSFFCRTEEEIAFEEEQKRKLLENQVEISFVIDQKRISEIAMCINTIKMSPDEIVEALINLDEWCFDEDTIYKLLRMCPSDDERKILEDNAERILKLSA